MYADSRYGTARLAIPISSLLQSRDFAEIDPRPTAVKDVAEELWRGCAG